MKKFLSLVTAASVFTASTAFGGGTVPMGYGMANDGRTVNIVPANSSLVRWTYYGNFDAQMKDEIMRAVASVDYETLDFRLLYGDTPPDPIPSNYVQVWFSGKSTAVFPECMDNTPGGCTFAETECLAKTKVSPFEFCSQYRVLVYVNNILYRAANPQDPTDPPENPYQKLYGIIRHEVGHVLGLKHKYPGPMTNNNDAPFHACQQLMWSLFDLNPAVPTWIYPTLPTSCQ
jgi:hypothetical protein